MLSRSMCPSWWRSAPAGTGWRRIDRPSPILIGPQDGTQNWEAKGGTGAEPGQPSPRVSSASWELADTAVRAPSVGAEPRPDTPSPPSDGGEGRGEAGDPLLGAPPPPFAPGGEEKRTPEGS